MHLGRWLGCPDWSITVAQADPRPHGVSRIMMWNRKSGEIMMTTLTFDDVAGGTRYTARVRHWPVDEEETHQRIGLEVQ